MPRKTNRADLETAPEKDPEQSALLPDDQPEEAGAPPEAPASTEPVPPDQPPAEVPPVPPEAPPEEVEPEGPVSYFAVENFKTMFQGQFLSYKEGDEIPEHVGSYLLETGSPVEKREG